MVLLDCCYAGAFLANARPKADDQVHADRIWTWHRRMAGDGTWDTVLQRLLTAAGAAGRVDWAVSVDSTIARAHQHATTIRRVTGGWVELHGSARRAA
ncbi:hypothetical protein GCM10022222_38520 [Amycolatopsis ultiminotia]|uniref:Uncharacterized protein n=1 Tax=Amycolatopsis ultiminotia TaxID=543629 RepID=A0ABP6WGM6_9PSEU